MELSRETDLNKIHKKKLKALFICHEKFLNPSSLEGGVKFCTNEYIRLITIKFDVTNIPVVYTNKLTHRLKKKLGLSAYDDFQPKEYYVQLKRSLDNKDANLVFLNLTNTIPFAEFIKKNWPHVKVVLCSHGNESGDHLHAIELHNSYKGAFRNGAIFTLGNMLVKESYFRKYIDLVLTVSDVEVGIEKWLGSKAILMVPRFIDVNNIGRMPIYGTVGFLADLTHEPNYFGIKEVCEALKKNGSENTTIRLVGGGKERGLYLTEQYSFVNYVGYLNEEELITELGAWSFALNPVFYYSRGVSTKLGKVLGMGLPVITTDIGLRGYEWKEGIIPVCKDADEMALLVQKLSTDVDAIHEYGLEVEKIQLTSASITESAEKMMKVLQII